MTTENKAVTGAGTAQREQTLEPMNRVMLQDDDKRQYHCSPENCGYDGEDYCQECGYEANERQNMGSVAGELDQPYRLRDEGRNPDGTGESYAERNR